MCSWSGGVSVQTSPLWELSLPELGVGILLPISESTHSDLFLRAYCVLLFCTGTGHTAKAISGKSDGNVILCIG